MNLVEWMGDLHDWFYGATRASTMQVAAVLSRRAEGIGWETCVHALASSKVQPTKSQDLMETSA